MTIGILVLAMASTIRPTSPVAIYAPLEHNSRRALMSAYVEAGTDRTKDFAEIVGGAFALAFGVVLFTGRVHGPRAREAPEAGRRLEAMLDQGVTMGMAVLPGPITHIPGAFYIIALNVFVAHNPRVATGTQDRRLSKPQAWQWAKS